MWAMIRPLLAALVLAGCARNDKLPAPVATTVPVASVVAAPIEVTTPAGDS